MLQEAVVLIRAEVQMAGSVKVSHGDENVSSLVGGDCSFRVIKDLRIGPSPGIVGVHDAYNILPVEEGRQVEGGIVRERHFGSDEIGKELDRNVPNASNIRLLIHDADCLKGPTFDCSSRKPGE